MHKYNKILLPVDGSKSSKLAKQHAISLATAMDAEILLVHITLALPAVITGSQREKLLREEGREAEEVLAPFRTLLIEQRINFDERVASAFNVGDEICKLASDENCDLIIMGSRGLGNLEGLELGSVTHRVLARCKVPVLVVR